MPSQGIAGRRALFAVLTLTTAALLLVLAVAMLRPGGFAAVDLALLALYAVTLPWIVIGFWNAVIGLLVMRLARDPTATVFPAARSAGDDPLTTTTAILVCIRNERPAPVARSIELTLSGLHRQGVADHFHLFILSDSDAGHGEVEAAVFAELTAHWPGAVSYRRRPRNDGFKAGNIRDFCTHHGADYDFIIPLDADSIMPASAMLRLVRLMQAQPRIGILQSLVIGAPAQSAFARIFQFGMRLGMRSYTIGGAWWQADCGPYWGHNAILRLAPFIAACDLPALSGGRTILSHDQIEAVLMRRAGYEVRVVPDEDLGSEQNPPTLLEFIRRDLRWCHGNMQYWPLLALPGLKLVSRMQLLLAILMFIGSPAWAGILLLALLLPAREVMIDVAAAQALFAITLIMLFAPKLATLVDVLCRGPLRRAYGGAGLLLAGVAIETVFSVLLAPIMWCGHTIFLARLVLGRPAVWAVQQRDDHHVTLAQACALWPQTLCGLVALSVFAIMAPAAMPYALYFMGGLVVAVPLAMLTAWPALGRLLARFGLCRLPEEDPALGRAAGAPVSEPLAP
jgi:membrane glycosyltransferase